MTLQIERILAFLARAISIAAKRIRGFAGLAHHQQDRFRIHHRRAIAKLRTVIHFGGNAGDLFEHELADQTGVPGRAASDQVNALDLFHLRWR